MLVINCYTWSDVSPFIYESQCGKELQRLSSTSAIYLKATSYHVTSCLIDHIISCQNIRPISFL